MQLVAKPTHVSCEIWFAFSVSASTQWHVLSKLYNPDWKIISNEWEQSLCQQVCQLRFDEDTGEFPSDIWCLTTFLLITLSLKMCIYLF